MGERREVAACRWCEEESESERTVGGAVVEGWLVEGGREESGSGHVVGSRGPRHEERDALCDESVLGR